MSTFRIVHRVEPYPHEDVVSLLTRVALRNHAGGPGELLAHISGSPTALVGVRDVPFLAHYCRLTTAETHDLSGIVQRGAGQPSAWRVSGEWITKSAFTAPHRAKICPLCLSEQSYVRGIWALTFYTACAKHGLRLVDRCPACKKELKWSRRRVDHCGCGYDLTQAPSVPIVGATAWLAWLIARRTEVPSSMPPSLPVDAGVDCLLELTLDGLLKVVWFLGHCIGDFDHCHTSHGREQPSLDEAQRIINRAFDLLLDWPQRLAAELVTLAERTPSNTSASLLDRVFGPAHYYLREEMQSDELSPIASAYEQIVLNIWRRAGHRCRSLHGSRQLPLAFA